MQSQSFYHVFNLPEELLSTLTPRNLVGQSTIDSHADPVEDSTPVVPSKSSTGCNVCPAANFSSVDEQRAHFRTDWHRYNVKIRLNGGTVVGETQFTQLLDNLEDSISGSESSSNDGGADNAEDDAVSALVNKAKRKLRIADNEDNWEDSRQQPLTPITWFHSPPATQIGVYRSLFNDPMQQPSDSLRELKEMQTLVPGGRKWAMFMVAGGHFAGAIIRVSEEEQVTPDGSKHKKQQKQKPLTEMLQHKTFHRYTTRRKQGGSQSTNDNAKGPAKSAGALLRRYGEQALRDDIRALLTEWAEDLYECERIWIRASVQNRRIFMDYDGSIIEKGDERIRSIPFPTRRPTQSEIARCLLELTRVKVSHLTEEALQAQDDAYLASLPKTKPVPKSQPEIPPKPKTPAPPKLSKEEELLREKWERLLEMILKGRLEPLKSFWTREEALVSGIENTRIPEWASVGQERTLLQFAAQSGQEETTRWILEELRADPTLTGVDDSDERTAYDLASTKETRNVFRRCAAAHPDWWDWFGAARVPSALTQEMEDEQDEKKKVRRKGLKDRIKERENREKEKTKTQTPAEEPPVEHQSAPVAEKGGPRRLGGAAAKGAQQGLAGLTPEMRMRVEREQRARAAEARLKTLSGR